MLAGVFYLFLAWNWQWPMLSPCRCHVHVLCLHIFSLQGLSSVQRQPEWISVTFQVTRDCWQNRLLVFVQMLIYVWRVPLLGCSGVFEGDPSWPRFWPRIHTNSKVKLVFFASFLGHNTNNTTFSIFKMVFCTEDKLLSTSALTLHLNGAEVQKPLWPELWPVVSDSSTGVLQQPEVSGAYVLSEVVPTPSVMEEECRTSSW